MTTIEAPRAHAFRVSLRELKEECYRALRAEGYFWGECQSAGRIMATNEILWGTGVASVLPDLTRRWVQRRNPRVAIRHGVAYLTDPRKTSVALVGAQATALTLGRAEHLVVVRGAVDLRGVAAAVWDMAPDGTTMLWGRRSQQDSSMLEGYSIDSAGDLSLHSTLPAQSVPVTVRRNHWFMTVGAPSGGQLVLSRQDRAHLLQSALHRGVEVNPQAWSTLLASSRKFLVPE